MPSVELLMPKLGESIMEATILKWLKKEGDAVALDEAVLEIATDKVDSEVPSTTAGIITKILFQEGDVVPIGTAIAIIGDGASNEAPAPTSAPQKVEAAPQEVVQNQVQEIIQNTVSNSDLTNQGDRFYSPLVLNIAREEGVSMQVLETIPGTGSNGRVTKKDILAFVSNKASGNGVAATQEITATVQKTQEVATPITIPTIISTPAASTAPAKSYSGNVEVMEMDRMRKMIADHMIMSKKTSAHVTSFVEADVTNIVMWREKNKNAFEKREGEKLTFTPIFIEAIVKAIKDFPDINVSVEGHQVIKKKDINIGMAAALPTGNLIVPVIKNADQYNLMGLCKKVNDFASRARQNKLKPEEIQDGTYTLSNVGTFGNVLGTPIINQPQVAIMAVGAIRKKPAVIETPQGDTIGIRHMMFLSHSYDHRWVDGFLGGSFVRRVADYLEQWDLDREI